MKYYIVTNSEKNMRLDKALVLFEPSFSRSFLSALIEDGFVLVNNEKCKASFKVQPNDVVSVDIPDIKPLDIKKEDIPLDVIFEDEDLLVINKPQGMVVHPSNGHHEGTLVNAILNHCEHLSGINGVARPGIVHRIDKDTSGLICVAKNDNAHHYLAEQLKDHTMAREYIALVKGVIKENSGTINMPIGRDIKNRQKMGINAKDGKEAITHFFVIKRFLNHTLIRCKLVTGRTHQIRVHMAEIGYPIEGDPLYSGKNYDKLTKTGQLLTAVSLKLIHPTLKEEMIFNIDIPSYFQDIIDNLD